MSSSSSKPSQSSTTSEDSTNNKSKEIPEEFIKVIRDFVTDIQNSFPEFVPLIQKWWKPRSSFHYIDEEDERERLYLEAEKKSIQFLYSYCSKKFPPRFFDILYQNQEIFSEDSEQDTEFLPHIHFKTLWSLDMSETTRETIWKYLQLILFSIIGNLENKDAFGDTSKMFEAIHHEEFKNKLEETLGQIHGLFEGLGKEKENGEEGSSGEGESGSAGTSTNTGGGSTSGNPFFNAENLHEHISGMMGGKLGQLAREIAEETSQSFNMDMDNNGDIKDVFQKLLKNPTKLMGLVKNIGEKLDHRMKSGDIKESELMAEATEMLNKMKNMPGMGNIQEMLHKMGMGGMAGMAGMSGAKMNLGAMEAQLNRNMKMAKTKERMKAKLDAKNQAAPASAPAPAQAPALTEEQLMALFAMNNNTSSSGEGKEEGKKEKVKKSKKTKK